jgi:Lon protease-like protein
MDELNTISNKIAATEADIAEAERTNNLETLNNLIELLTAQQTEKNILLRSALTPVTPGNPPSNSYLN